MLELEALRQRCTELEADVALMREAVDAGGANLCVLDEHGIVRWVSASWRASSRNRGGAGSGCEVGADYVAQCSMPELGGPDGELATGVRRVLAAERDEYGQVYACPSLATPCWYRAHFRAFTAAGRRLVSVLHEDVSATHRAADLWRVGGGSQETMGVEVFWIRPDGSIAGASERASRALGYTREELVRMRVFDIDLEHPAASWPAHWDRLRALGAMSFESVQRRKDGRERDVFICANLVVDGGIERSCSMVIDLTELRSAENELRVSEARYRELFDAAPDAVFLVAADGHELGRILDVNQQAVATHGYTRAELVAMNIADLDDPQSAAAAPGRLRQLVETGSASFEVEHRRKDGSWFPVGVSASLAIVRGRRCVVSFNRDITAAKLAEAELRDQQVRLEMAAEGGDIGFWDWDVATDRVFYSPQWKAQLGCSDADIEPRYQEWESRLHPDDREAALAGLARHQLGADTTYESEFRLRHRDGSYRWIYTRGRSIRDAAGSVTRMIGCHVDITNRMRAEEERSTMARKVAQLQKLEAIGTLAGGIAHDFNNILAIVQGNLELAAEHVAGNWPLAQSLAEIARAADRASALVRQILVFGRCEAPNPRLVALAQVVREVGAFMRSTLPAAIAIRVDIDADVPNVLADASQIYQALVNLCTNAWHAMEGRSGTLQLGLRAVELDARAAAGIDGIATGRFACLFVSDTGVGMSASTLKRLFEPFFTTKPVGKGTGLGLSVVHGIVRSHSGGITVTSEVGNGTTFRIYLPVAAGVAQAEPLKVQSERSLPGRGDGRHILLIDDEQLLLRAMKLGLERWGYRVTALERPAQLEACGVASGVRFDLVVTDYEMPGQSGLEVVRRLRDLLPDVPVILCSGHLRPEVLRQIQEFGVRRVMTKPFAPAELAMAIQGVLDAADGSRPDGGPAS